MYELSESSLDDFKQFLEFLSTSETWPSVFIIYYYYIMYKHLNIRAGLHSKYRHMFTWNRVLPQWIKKMSTEIYTKLSGSLWFSKLSYRLVVAAWNVTLIVFSRFTNEMKSQITGMRVFKFEILIFVVKYL